jgi:response regulator NasT
MSPVRLLLADDDRLVLATLTHGLREAGYAVDAAESGAAALALAGHTRYDLALLDIRMPGMTGIELAARLRTEHGLPAMFLSAYSDRGQIEAAVSGGIVGYLVKPVDHAQLVPAIECALARARDLAALLQAKTQLEQALAGGRATSIAIGILMERRQLGEKAAFEQLRSAARKRQQKIEAHATELVAAVERLNTP